MHVLVFLSIGHPVGHQGTTTHHFSEHRTLHSTMAPPADTRPFDIVLLGATGFVGELNSACLHAQSSRSEALCGARGVALAMALAAAAAVAVRCWSSCQLGELQRFAIAYTCRQAGVRGGGPQLRRDRQMGNHREASRPPRQGCTPAAADCRSRCRRRRGGSLAVCGARNSMARSVCKQRGSLHSSQG